MHCGLAFNLVVVEIKACLIITRKIKRKKINLDKKIENNGLYDEINSFFLPSSMKNFSLSDGEENFSIKYKRMMEYIYSKK